MPALYFPYTFPTSPNYPELLSTSPFRDGPRAISRRAHVEDARSFADALSATALVFLPLEILRQLIRPHGIATAHFGWPQLVIKPLGQAVRRFGWIGLTLVFLATFLLRPA